MENKLFGVALFANSLDKIATYAVQHPQNYVYEANPLPYLYGFNGLVALTILSFIALFFLRWLYGRYIPNPKVRMVCWAVVIILCFAGFLSNILSFQT